MVISLIFICIEKNKKNNYHYFRTLNVYLIRLQTNLTVTTRQKSKHEISRDAMASTTLGESR